MGIEGLIGVLGFVGTLLLVLVGLLNFSVFRKPDVDDSEIERRKQLLQLYRNGEVREAIDYTSYSMKRRR
jgi:hypothetical protein